MTKPLLDLPTLVCCIEYGRLELETVLMVRSLRKFGGDFARARVLAVVGRSGAALRRETLDYLDQLEVTLRRAQTSDNRYPWFNYANKVAAVQLADREATTTTVVWLDSDVLFAAQPDGLILADEEDFAGRCEPLPPAVYDNFRISEPYWRDLCDLLGVSFDDIPWVDRADGRPRQRASFNSGVFAWRRASGFARHYRDAFETLLASRRAQSDGNFFAADQVVLSPLMLKLGLRWRHLDIRDHHMVFQGLISGPLAALPMNDSAVIHYSRSLSSPHRGSFLARLRAELPELATWLEEAEPQIRRSSLRRAHADVLRVLRGLRWRAYARRVVRSAVGA
jgi:hypothetical protein